MSAPLPKPPRVEKWQRWRNEMGEVLVLAIEPSSIVGLGDFARLANGYGIRPTQELLTWPEWHFLGYAKPDKVEVGQRWRSPMREYVVESVTTHTEQSERVVNLRCESGRVIPMPLVVFFEEPAAKGWEYLGMAESEGAKKEAPRTYAGPQSVIAAKTEYVTVDDLSAPPIQTKRTADQARQDARRANEEAAKRLIANPPKWAYTKAWMCAVLAAQEWCARFAPDSSGMPVQQIEYACTMARDRAPEHGLLISGGLTSTVYRAYARGMERPSPLIGRPGVKGGISTCDLGGEYE